MEIIHISIVAIIAIICLLFAQKVLTAKGDSKINKSFVFFAIVIALWVILDFSLYQQSLAQFQTFLNRLNLANICLLVISLAYFVTVFPKEIFKMPKFVYFISIAITAAMIIVIIFTGSIVHDAFMQDYGSNFNQGSLFFIFAIFATIFALYSIIVLITKYVKLVGEEKKQIKYIFYGIIFLVIFNLSFNLFIPMVTHSFIYGRFGTYSAIFFVGFTAYAILKTHLFNLRIIMTEAAIIIINTILAIQIFSSQTVAEGILRTIFLAIVIYGSIILLRSVRKEIKQREELQKLTQQLEKLNTKLKELDAMKTEFVSVASHELLTPISAIEGYLSMMLDEKMVKIDNPKAIEYLGNVYQSAKRLAKLVADLLNVSRIEQGRLLVEKTLIKMRNVIAEVRTELKFKAQDAKLDLNVYIPKDVHTAVYADADKIKEVLVNLCGNSLKFTKAGGKVDVSAEIWSTHKLKEKYEHTIEELEQKEEVEGSLAHTVNRKASKLLGDNQLVISVKDTGMGISKEGLSKLFQKFSRVGTWSNHSVPGTGLGLYISKSLVEMHHGRIWAESEGEGKGSTFYFTLPLASAKKEVEEVDKEALPTAKDAKPLARTGLEGQIKSGNTAKPEEKAAPAPTETSQPKTEPEPQPEEHPKTLAGEDLDEKPKIKDN